MAVIEQQWTARVALTGRAVCTVQSDSANLRLLIYLYLDASPLCQFTPGHFALSCGCFNVSSTGHLVIWTFWSKWFIVSCLHVHLSADSFDFANDAAKTNHNLKPIPVIVHWADVYSFQLLCNNAVVTPNPKSDLTLTSNPSFVLPAFVMPSGLGLAVPFGMAAPRNGGRNLHNSIPWKGIVLFSVPRDGNQGLKNAIFRPWRTENKELCSLYSIPWGRKVTLIYAIFRQ